MRKFWFVGLLSFYSLPIWAVELPTEQDRLIATGRLWNTISYFHPYLAYRQINWDQALVAALPRIRAAKEISDYQAGITELLAPLQDPGTRVISGTAIVSQSRPEEVDASKGVRSWMHSSLSDSMFVVKHGVDIESAVLPMGGDLQVSVRLSEAVLPSLPAVPTLIVPQVNKEQTASYPAVEWRILAAYKLWGVIRQFFAYRDLMDEDWDQAFVEFLPKWIAAKDAREYHLAVAEAATHLNDSHVRVSSSVLDDYFGVATPGLRVELVDKKPVVTGIFDPAAKAAGVQIGDLVTTVDGENTVDRIKREADYISFSTQQALSASVSERLLNGPEGSLLSVGLRNSAGETREVKLKRQKAEAQEWHRTRTADSLKWLTPEIGYMDLERLPTNQVDAAFQKFAQAKAIVFDGRGDTLADPLAIASRLTDKTDVPACIVTGALWLSPDEPDGVTVTHTASYFQVRRLARAGSYHFAGKTAFLIDGRTIGRTELTGLFMEAANNTAFIGTASAGAESETDTFTLPGGISFSFSRTDVRHSNGGKLQRLGLQPTLVIPATVSDVRSGNDEVLSKATEYLSTSLTSAQP